MKPTYEEAKKAKETLIEYLKEVLRGRYIDVDEKFRYNTEMIVFLALTQDYFLD